MIFQETTPEQTVCGNLAGLAAQVATWRETSKLLCVELVVSESPILDFAEKVQKLSELPNNWDGNKARPIRHKSSVNAIRLFCELMFEGSPVPDVVPTVCGNLQLEWHLHGIDLEVEIDESGRISVLYEDSHKHDDEWSESFNYGVARLKPIIEELTIRELGKSASLAA